MATEIVIVGAGYGGVLTAKSLAKKFKKRQDVNITIIDKNPYHTMLTELHEVAAGRVEEDSIKISLKKIFAGRRVNVKLDMVKSIDFEKKNVIGDAATYRYDYLVLAAGSKPAFFGVPGAEENAFRLWSYDDAVVLREHIHNCFRLAAVERNKDEKKRLLSFYVVGAGFTGVEMIGELAEYVPILCDRYEIDPKDVTLVNVDMLARPMTTLPEKLSVKVANRLKKMGVTLKMNTGVACVTPAFIEIKEGNNQVKLPTKTVIWAAGVQCSDITQKVGEKLSSAARGRIKQDSYLRSVDDESVYVVGDNMLFTPKGSDTPVPQMVENAEHSSACVAHNIYVAVTKTGKMEEYNPSFHGVMVCVGGRYGVARVGLPNMMFNLPSFFAMLSKHFINIIYFLQVLGWNKCFSYLRHEFFTIRNKRSFVGGHLSNRTPSFLLVLLRLWLGAVWLFEGIKKVNEGWLSNPMLTGFFGGANAWYQSILYGTAGGAEAVGAASGVVETAASGAAEVASAASGVVEAAAGGASAGVTILNHNILWLFDIIFVSSKDLVHSTIENFAFKLNVPLLNSFLDTFVLPYDGVQIAMQVFIVVAEILIGLALIGGLFTFLAAGLSVVLQFMFVSTTGLYLSTFWMIFAGIAVLVGGGSVFGLDYYVMPYLKKLWKKTNFARKLYIYND